MKQFKGPKYQQGFLGIVSAIVSVGSAIAGASKARQASKANRRANQTQRQINEMKNFQAKRQFLRNFRQAQAAALAGGVARGASLESSGVQSARASQGSQAITATGEFNRMDELGALMTHQLNSASKYSAQSSAFGALSQFAGQFAQFSSPGQDPRRIPGDDSGAVTSKPSIFNVPGG
mgnify:CR=1 FL=1